jgi:RNA polymerase sigma-70 factor (ECF subfamily)
MLASFDEADDAVQETFLRAWRARDSFDDDGGGLRAWLYRIATNVCLDSIRRRKRRVGSLGSSVDVPWLQPYPDRLLDQIEATEEGPAEAVVGRETIELAFLAALQVLPPRQRAVLIARDVLGWPATDTAALLDTSVPAANSALQRAREAMADRLPSHRNDWSARVPSSDEERLLERFIDASNRCDADAALAIAATDIRITMPPYPMCFEGISSIAPLMTRAFGPDRDGDWQLVPTRANRMPTAASYLRRHGDAVLRAFKFDVLRIEGDKIVEITTLGPELFEAFGLPLTL